MNGFCGDIESMARENSDFRNVLYTASHSQLVLMNLKPGEEIGLETHDENDQGKVLIDGNEYPVTDGTAVIVPAGARHNVINTSASLELKIYTIYSPAHHKDGIVRATKAEAESDAPEYDGRNSE
jgi:mannose-6-phosphate isomerase-like protein (cupin superfamily)